MLKAARHIIVGIIDFFHKPFAKLIPTTTFRYLACGGTNTVLNIFIQFLAINFVLHKQSVHVYGNFIISPEVAAYMIAFCFSFPPGFIMSRYIVFPESQLHGRVQLFRYGLTTISFIIISYLLVRFFAFTNPEHPTVSYTFVCIITAVLSYISQRKFTFKVDPVEEEILSE
ncbi:MAG: phenylalanine 4-monooxygenase [Flavipsychrobacter sp.]|nr:phenylalanine 4-monooxygenase [Flavipsychrobacter sp.]